ncbi:hypothetical protein E0765_02095 [Sulfuricurvum sp. IAE1]|uniref:hypothetical protein n=1 Tax=Sulfuricurvum sp. IAE1 TaxID=2546102 RepID=UPI00105105CB|nr:hypothetical protein [Sulfuricurvum sp. IAE1]TDA69231.1 hypothetical protein E0765_02095 [Sulfuricurvum sp. IAE1]
MRPFIFLGLLSALTLQAALTTASPAAASPLVPAPQQDKELAWVDEQIRSILPARVGISDSFINSLRDPVKLKKPAATATPLQGGNKLLPPPKLGSTLTPPPPQIVEEPLRLMALMNQSALISGKWYRAGENVRGYTLSEIKPSSVLLTGKKAQKLILFLTKQNNNIKINTK